MYYSYIHLLIHKQAEVNQVINYHDDIYKKALRIEPWLKRDMASQNETPRTNVRIFALKNETGQNALKRNA